MKKSIQDMQLSSCRLITDISLPSIARSHRNAVKIVFCVKNETIQHYKMGKNAINRP